MESKTEALGYLFCVDFPEDKKIPKNIRGRKMVYYDMKTHDYHLDNMHGKTITGKARKIAETANRDLE